MRVTLESRKYGKKHSFNIVATKMGVLLTTPNGKAIAELIVETGETDIKGDDDKYVVVPTDNFFISFQDLTRSGMKDASFVEVDQPEAS